MNAYELADFIDKYCEDNTSKEAAVLLRQQADRIADLETTLAFKKIKPLSDEEILNLYKETGANNGGIREFVRAIEERHGIK